MDIDKYIINTYRHKQSNKGEETTFTINKCLNKLCLIKKEYIVQYTTFMRYVFHEFLNT